MYGKTQTASLLRDAGFEAYVVGGFARDTILGKTPKDNDLATNASPSEVMRIVQDAGLQVIPTGLQHGTVTVVERRLSGPGSPCNDHVEVTTYRVDGTYTDGRRPDSVTFAGTIEEDLSRRDFTINAMAMDPYTGKVIDPHDGRGDLQRGIIRCVGNPLDRFLEDALRPVRAARFAAQLDFVINYDTIRAARDPLVSSRLHEGVAPERLREETLKAMTGKKPALYFENLDFMGLLPVTFPHLVPMKGMAQPAHYHKYDVWKHSLEALRWVDTTDPLLRFIAMFHDIGKPATFKYKDDGVTPTFINHEDVGADILDGMMTQLRFDNDSRRKAVTLVRNHLVLYEPRWSHGAVRRLVARVGADNVNDLLALRRADIIAHGHDPTQKLEELEQLRQRVYTLRNEGTLTIKKLAVNGHDVIALGAKGKQVGEVLAALNEAVTDDPTLDNRETLLGMAREQLEKRMGTQ
jgi:tRNA nucleotidyltransferase (CCA-adding enzyme)